MKGIAKRSGINKAMQVVGKVTEGSKVTEACREVGMPRSTFYAILMREPAIFAHMEEIINVSSRQQLAMIVIHQTNILRKLIDQGLDDSTSARDRIAIWKTLDELQNKLTDQIRIPSKHQTIELDLSGPVLRPGKSRFDAAGAHSTRGGESNVE